LLKMVEAEQAPLHLLLGSDALKLVRARINALTAELDQWESVSQATDYLPLS